jgi:two-component system OmpR family response regulator
MQKNSPGMQRRESWPDELKGLRVLVVDDDPDARRLLMLIFSKAGALVKEAPSSDIAMVSLRDFQPQLLISDIDMPIEDGCGLMRRIRTLRADAGGAIPAIALTGRAEPAAQREVLQAGFTTHLAKPVSPTSLLETARALTRGA